MFKLQRYMSGDAPAMVLSAILAVAVVVSLISAILVVVPRHRADGATSLYWAAWPEHRDTFVAARQAGDDDWLFAQYLGNVDNLAAINRAKYRFVGFAFRGLMVAVLAYVLLLLSGASTATAF